MTITYPVSSIYGGLDLWTSGNSFVNSLDRKWNLICFIGVHERIRDREMSAGSKFPPIYSN